MYRKGREIRWGRWLTAGLLACTFISFCMNMAGKSAKKTEFPAKSILQEGIRDKTVGSFFPFFTFLDSTGHETNFSEILYRQICRQMPLYDYCMTETYDIQTENGSTYEMLLRREGMDEETTGSSTIDMEEDFEEALRKENDAVLKSRAEEENQTTQENSGFQEHMEKQQVYDISQYKDYNQLVGEFYAIDATTMANEELLNVDKFMAKQMSVDKNTEGPQILIYHTHSQETFADSVPGDTSTSVVGAGEKLAGLLRDKYGFQVLHHTGQYDVEKRDYAYSKAAPALEQILAENPTIQVVIDLHRDEVAGDRKLLTDIDGRPTAKCMFFNGLSRTRKIGEIEYLQNPYREDNLAFAFRMQLACNEYYPGFTRKIYLKGYRYNLNYCPKSLLIELGAQTNTVEEVMNACDPLAHAIAMVLNGEE